MIEPTPDQRVMFAETDHARCLSLSWCIYNAPNSSKRCAVLLTNAIFNVDTI